MKEGKVEAVMLTLGVDFFKMYPGGKEEVIRVIERLNVEDDLTWWQLCGSGIPKVECEFAYLVWDGKIQYRCNVEKYLRDKSGSFNDGGITRVYRHKNMISMIGPAVKAPHDIPQKGFQGFRYSPFIF
jgi:hypothetical protein